MLVRKFSRVSQKEFVLFGTIAQSPEGAGVDASLCEEDTEEAEPPHLKVVIMQFIEALSEMESTFTGRLDNEIVVDPIALYREI